MNLDRIVFAWAANSYTGWGVLGLNWMLHWPGIAVSAMPDFTAELGPDDTRRLLLCDRLDQSAALQRELAQDPAPAVAADAPVFVGLGGDFQDLPVAGGKRLIGRPTIALPIFEDAIGAGPNVDRLRQFALTVCGSRWNRDFLSSLGIDAVLCRQGYDRTIFHPGVRRVRRDGRFRVFSGGKAEYRKGQDIVLQAFARFADRHDDAMLVAAWDCEWPELGQSFGGTAVGGPPGADVGKPDFQAWAQQAGIRSHQIEMIPRRPNWRMAAVYGSCDCAVFPNRAEGGTNLVAMECMACGLPTMLSHRTGHLDLLETCPAAPDATDPEQIITGLEQAYDSGGGAWGTLLGEEWAWPTRIAELVETLHARP